MTALTIGGLAREGGVGVETVRYYQRRGLLPTPPPGGAGGVRRYGEEEVRRLRFIRSAQAAGFTLQQIEELTALDARTDRDQVLALANTRLDELDARIAELRSVRRALARLADACAAAGQGACPIIIAFEEASGADATISTP